MELEERLKRIVSDCTRSKRSEHQKTLKEFLELTHEAAVRTAEGADLSSKLDNSLHNIMQALKETADYLDAAAHIEELVFNSTNGCIYDIPTKTKRPYEAYQDDIRAEFESGNISFRPYVYVLWRAKSPSQFLYIGKATDEGRLLGSNHVKLAASLPLSTTISLVFPHQSKPENISNLEASLIRLVEFETGKIPVNNAKRENLDGHDASNRLEALADLFQHLGEKLDPFID